MSNEKEDQNQKEDNVFEDVDEQKCAPMKKTPKKNMNDDAEAAAKNTQDGVKKSGMTELTSPMPPSTPTTPAIAEAENEKDKEKEVEKEKEKEKENVEDKEKDKWMKGKEREAEPAVSTPEVYVEKSDVQPIVKTESRDAKEKNNERTEEKTNGDKEIQASDAEKVPKKKKKKKKDKTIREDENNAVGKVCGEDLSWDEKKKKPNKKKEDPNNAVGVVLNDEISWDDDKKKKKKKQKEASEKKKMDDTKKDKQREIMEKTLEASLKKKKDGEKKKKELSLRRKPGKKDKTLILPAPEVHKTHTNTSKRQRPKNDRMGKKYGAIKTDGFFKSLYNKAKTSIGMKLNKYDDTFIANTNTDTVKTMINDIVPEYKNDPNLPPAEKPFDNFDNNGNIFPNGRPFWCTRDEKLPATNIVMANAVKEITEGKCPLTSMKCPKDLDPFGPLEELQARDEEFFKKEKRILINTVRSTVYQYEAKNLAKKGLMASDSCHEQKSSINNMQPSYVFPKQLIQYNRKCRTDAVNKIQFTPGLKKKKKVDTSNRHKRDPK